MNKEKNINKRLKKISKQKKRKEEETFHNYICSIPFVYMWTFAILNYFLDKDTCFINTFGVTIIDFISKFIYLKMSVCQFEIDERNNYFRNIKESKFFEKNLINKENGGREIVAFKLPITFIVALIYFLCCTFSKKIEFMDGKNAFEFTMFYLSTIYIDPFWNGRSKLLSSDIIPLPPKKETHKKKITRWINNFKICIRNLNRIYEINEKNVFKCIIYWMFILFVMLYQPYQLIKNIFLLIQR